MITLKDKSNNRWLGQISYAQLKFLNDELVTEHKYEQEYLVNREKLAVLKVHGADAALAAIIEKALGDKYSIEFYWVKS
jgi:hypothetical protein